jgi:hypothetical protein
MRLDRAILLCPDWVARRAARAAPDARGRWMLGQAYAVRCSFVREVLDRDGPDEDLAQVWMLRQPDAVRESYITQVLETPPAR